MWDFRYEAETAAMYFLICINCGVWIYVVLKLAKLFTGW